MNIRLAKTALFSCVHQCCKPKSSCLMRKTAVKRISFFLECLMFYEVYLLKNFCPFWPSFLAFQTSNCHLIAAILYFSLTLFSMLYFDTCCYKDCILHSGSRLKDFEEKRKYRSRQKHESELPYSLVLVRAPAYY